MQQSEAKKSDRPRVAIVGGGPVGAICACFLAQRNYDVDVYEMRPDMRQQEFVRGRSINIALSTRGREALRAVRMENHVTSEGIPMYARMIHTVDSKKYALPYARDNQKYIMSIDRRRLTESLLTLAEKNERIRLHFNHKLLRADIKTGELTFSVRVRDEEECNADSIGQPAPKAATGGYKEQVVDTKADVILGCDGAFSAVRRELAKQIRFDYSQAYLDTAYIEITMPPDDAGKHKMELNYLHIWARHEFMMIALPNKGGDFTMTLFLPFSMFEQLKRGTRDEFLKFFRDTFPDAVPLVGESYLCDTFFKLTPQPLIYIKCNPLHASQTLLLGDAAHAMVPFYGQGMNSGFEDCLILDQILERTGDLTTAIAEFDKVRLKDAHAICDLALRNHIEMRSDVLTWSYYIRKKVDYILNGLLGDRWIPLYEMVTFSRIPYSQCISKREHQDKLLRRTRCTALALLGFSAFWLYYNRQRLNRLPLINLLTAKLRSLPLLK